MSQPPRRADPRRADPKRGLGRGLSALLGEDHAPDGPPADPVLSLPLDLVEPNPDQPRRRFDETALSELAASIRERGVLQPIIVRPDPSRTGHHQIVAGERRWRAAAMAGLHEIPAIRRDLDDRAVLEIAIIENIQRSDLNPMEEAEGYGQLIESFGYTQEALARVLGKSRSHLANLLRLRTLPVEVQEMLRRGEISAGHARALVTAPDPASLAREAAAKSLSVRQTEARAKEARIPGPGPSGTADPPRRGAGGAPEKDPDTRMLEGDLSAAVGLAVQITQGPGGEGELRIRYRTLEDLDRLCQRLAG